MMIFSAMAAHLVPFETRIYICCIVNPLGRILREIKKSSCLITKQLDLTFVELAGFEPASGQSAITPSTCLVSD